MATSTPHRHETSSAPDAPSTDADEWPWQCLDCRSPIFDDGDFCRACEATHRSVPSREAPPAPGGFIGWMRRERYPSFLVKISTVSGVEVALTALWLRALLLGPVDLLSGIVILA